MKPKIVTIGVYGFSEHAFFQALQDAHIDTFCDLRARRGVRGPDYTFANSARLQQHLAELHIRYIHLKQLAPSEEIRALQDQVDKQAKIAKRKRGELCEAFREAYQQNYLIAYVGFVEPPAEIPANTLVRVSMCRWFKREEYSEERCYLQISGWYL